MHRLPGPSSGHAARWGAPAPHPAPLPSRVGLSPAASRHPSLAAHPAPPASATARHSPQRSSSRARRPAPPQSSSAGSTAGPRPPAEEQRRDGASDGSNGASTSGRHASGEVADPGAGAPRVRGARVEVRGMVKHYSTKAGVFKAVDGVDTVLEPGTITALLGPSGSGKTTLLRLIAGLDPPTAGTVSFDGEDVTRTSVQDRALGVVFQGYALFKHMTVADNVGFGPRMRRTPGDPEARVADLLRLIELGELAGRYPPQLSGGQKQRVAVARALACDPRVLLLDEPFGALDPVVRRSLRAGLRAIVRRVGVTTIMVTHDQEEAWDIADNVVVFNRGRVEQEGSPAHLARHPATPFVMNFVGDVAHLPAGCQFVRRMGPPRGAAPGKTHVMVRPGDLTILKEFTEPYICPATVADKANVGWAVRYFLRFDDGVEVEWTAGRQEDARLYDLDVGQRVYVRADPQRMMAFSYDDLGVDPTAPPV